MPKACLLQDETKKQGLWSSMIWNILTILLITESLLPSWFHLKKILKVSFLKRPKKKKELILRKCQVVILRKNSRSCFLYAPNSIFYYLEFHIVFVFCFFNFLLHTVWFKSQDELHLNLSYWTSILFSGGTRPACYNTDIEIRLNQHLRNTICNWKQHPVLSVFLFQ